MTVHELLRSLNFKVGRYLGLSDETIDQLLQHGREYLAGLFELDEKDVQDLHKLCQLLDDPLEMEAFIQKITPLCLEMTSAQGRLAGN